MIFKEDSIMNGDAIVMHKWEDLMMKKHAEVVCQNGGDILEIGFGMGISADYIQTQDINSHTIIEQDKQIYEKLLEWSKDKPNVKTIFGDWITNLPEQKFDGVFRDTWGESLGKSVFPLKILNVCKVGTIVTFFNNTNDKETMYGTNMWGVPFFKDKELKFYKIDIKIPDYVDYLPNYNRDRYYVPEWVVDETDTKEKFESILSQRINK
tara:strand:+ start:57 stop:683 length:627 start_codon:yes stop_codon:yes gene_type:complete